MINENLTQEVTTDFIVFGAGCFWCIEALFSEIEGVQQVVPGYCGGESINPTYSEVCSGSSGHAEVVKITYNSDKVKMADLYSVFFATHDPTTLNRQGNDIGSQYRSAIFYNSESQRVDAELAKKAAQNSGDWDNLIVTEITELQVFYPAENYHDNYYSENKDAAYCRAVIAPKLSKFRMKFETMLKNRD